jgi:hypothetical protein
VKRITISDIVVKFRRIKKRAVVYLLLVKRCYHLERLLTYYDMNEFNKPLMWVT